MSEASLANSIALLERMPPALDGLLRGLPDEWTHRNEGENTWTVFDVVGHLIHGEYTNWIPRAKWILQYGESKPFEPFDRTGQEKLRGMSLPQLLDEFSLARSQSIAELHTMNLRPADFARRGHHPALGTVTLAQLLATWAAHDLTHLHQISRIMAHQYREAVGPWRKFLGVMECTGHSAPA